MRTTEERMQLIRQRTDTLKQEQKKRKQRIINTVCVAACLLLVVGLGLYMPGLTVTSPQTIRQTAGTASLLGQHAALGYIIMGLLCFLLGVTVTILLYRLHHAQTHVKPEDDDDEL